MDSNTADIYVQMIDPHGNTHWAENGIRVCTATSTQLSPSVVKGPDQSVIIVWDDYRGTDYDIYAQRLDIHGNLLWGTGGIPVCSNSGDQSNAKVVPDGSGGAIITWTDYRYGLSDADIYVQRIDADGSGWWGTNGYPVCGSLGNQQFPEIVKDGSGGAVIVWEDERGGNDDIYAQRMDHAGVSQWAPDGVVVTSAANSQIDPHVVSDGNGGAIVAWVDYRSLDYDIYAQRISGDGNTVWGAGDVGITTLTGTQYLYDVVSDGNGGAIFVWNDYRDIDSNVYAQRLNRNGIEQWSAGGRWVCGTSDNQFAYGACPDLAGGIIISLTDDRNGDRDIYIQRLEESGGYAQWGTYGVALCDYHEDQAAPCLFTDFAGGAVVVWMDSRNSVTYDLYAQRVTRGGYWGYPCPDFNGVADVPFDQGGSVLLSWGASRLDQISEAGLGYYSVWRNLGFVEMQAMMEDGLENRPTVMPGPDFDGEAYRFISLEGAMFGFEWIGNVTAHMQESYSYAAATYYDSTAADPADHTFMVSAHLSTALYWDSWVLWGCSKDNMSPCPPLALAGQESSDPEGLRITWSPNAEADLGWYNIYRDDDPSFEPVPDNLLDSTCDTILLDEDWAAGAGFCYKVAAVDIHGNESEYSMICEGDVTGDDPMPMPEATFLAQNYPNPFNPVTTIAFALRESGHVSLRIYDAGGRLVTTLVDESRPAGRYSTEWNGRDVNGSTVASSVYFYKLVAGDFVQTRKMVLLR